MKQYFSEIQEDANPETKFLNYSNKIQGTKKENYRVIEFCYISINLHTYYKKSNNIKYLIITC